MFCCKAKEAKPSESDLLTDGLLDDFWRHRDIQSILVADFSVEVNDAQHIPFVDQVGLLKTFFSSLDSIWIPIVTGQQPTLSICFRSRMDANPWCLYAITKMSGVGVCKHACFFRSFVIELLNHEILELSLEYDYVYVAN